MTDTKTITIGIQGGRGSFNEEAVIIYLQHNKITNAKIKHLQTTENVLKQLNDGEIDQGQFAVHNTLGGIVHESFRAMGKYSFEPVADYAMQIEHALMARQDATIDEIDTIMTHPQIFAQCKTKLEEKYKHLKQVVGEGELTDHAKVAVHLAEKKLPKNVAVMGSRVLAQVYSLKIIEESLQDKKDIYTTFLLVKKH
jgi:prephenate dehydratase